MRAQAYFSAPLRSQDYESLQPILATPSFDPENLVGISARFLENADVYTRTYTASQHFRERFQKAFKASGIDAAGLKHILDMGSGPGTNSIMPLSEIIDGVHIVASDISLNLLAILAGVLHNYPYRDNIDLVAWDAMSAGEIAAETFDMVTGASVLHHLMDPTLAYSSAFKALKPGGRAVFIEPFDGFSLILGMFKSILAFNADASRPLSPAAEGWLKMLVVDYEARFAGQTPADFALLEDKWLFTPERMRDEALAAGFRHCEIQPHYAHDTLYRDYGLMQLSLAGGEEATDLPQWALDVFDSFDRAVPKPAKSRMILEGTAVLTK
jgi:SAM-dependent methyltransferase